MKRRKECTWIIAIIGISILFLFQLILVSRLFQLDKNHFYEKIDERITGSICQLNMSFAMLQRNEKNFIAYECALNKLSVIVEGIKYFFIEKDKSEKEILERVYYDVAHKKWSAAHLDSLVRDYMYECYHSVPLKVVIRDSLGKSIDEAGNVNIPSKGDPCFGPVPLGYVTGRTLEAYYYFPFINFLYHESDRIVMTVALFVLLVFFICFLIRTIRVERKTANVREEFMYIVVHNLQSPVDFVRRVSYEIKDRAQHPYSDEQERLYDELKRRLEIMGEGIRRLLTHSVGLYGMRLEKSVVNLREMIERIVRQYRMISGRQIDVDCTSDDVCLVADSVHLAGAIANLVENAVKYTAENNWIKVKCAISGKYVQIVVADNGPGIPDEEMKRIFRKYYRGTGGHKGFGLGLNYVWKVVQAHHGRITVRSKGGCEFTISLPWTKR